MSFNQLLRSKLNPMKSWIIAIFSFCVAVGCMMSYRAIHHVEKKPEGFALAQITVQQLPQGNFSCVIPDEVSSLFKNPFLFLGKDRQFFTFVSSDGPYLIKFFQQQNGIPDQVSLCPKWLHNYSFSRQAKKKEARKVALLKSVELSIAHLSAETGVVAAHLYSGPLSLPSITLVDKEGESHVVDLNTTQFVIQKRAELLDPTLVRLMGEHKEAEAKQCIDAIFDLLVTVAKKGVQDADGSLIRNDNIGFIDGRAVYIDIGKLECVEGGVNEVRFRHDFRRIKPLYNWLKKNYPRLAHHFAKKREQIVYP